MLDRTYTWKRPNNEIVKFKGFSKPEMNQISPALERTDTLLNENKKLNAVFIKKNPIFPKRSKRVAAETRYLNILPGQRAKVYVNPVVFEQNKYQWQPAGVVAHEIGHLVGPTRNTNRRERSEFRRTFGYRKENALHEYAPQMWKKKRDNILKGAHTRQAHDASEDFSETWRALTGIPFSDRTNGQYFNVMLTPQRVNYMKKRVLRETPNNI